MIRKNFDVTYATYGSYGCSVTNRTWFCFLRYGTITLQYVTERQVQINVTVSYVTLREGAKQAVVRHPEKYSCFLIVSSLFMHVSSTSARQLHTGLCKASCTNIMQNCHLANHHLSFNCPSS